MPRNNVNNEISCLIFGMETLTTFPCPFLINLTLKFLGIENVLSHTDLISATQIVLLFALFTLKIYSLLSAIFSCETITFSAPFTYKITSRSYLHSPIV